jgi:FKBP-type peptidyl-prolyl cis-trans isomerase
MQVILSVIALLAVPSAAWMPCKNGIRVVTHNKATELNMQSEAVSRKAFVNSLIAGAIAVSSTTTGALPSLADETLPNGVTYKVIKEGSGPKPEIGELVAIRFKAFCGEQKIDDIFDTPEPYYSRLGSGGLLQGVEQTLPLMRLGDRWELTIPVCTHSHTQMYILYHLHYSFGPKRNYCSSCISC